MWLSALIALVALWYGYRRSTIPESVTIIPRRKRSFWTLRCLYPRKITGIQINHVTTFTFGFLFYWVLPPLAGFLAQTEAARDLLHGWYDYLTHIPSLHIFEYNLSILAFYIAFALGDRVGYKRPQPRQKTTFHKNLWRAEWYAVLVVFLVMIVIFRNQLFAGYTVGSPLQGTAVAISLVLLGLAWEFKLAGYTGYMKVYFGCAAILLLMGGRLYFASSVISILVYASHKRPFRIKKIVQWGLVAVVLMGAVGTVRTGASASLIMIFLNVGTESIFTSYSLMSYLSGNEPPLFNLPIYLGSDLMNLIPSAFIDKSKFANLIDSNPFGIVSPLGAFHSWVSSVINFGVVGTIILMFLFGYFMRRNERMTTPYLMLTAFTAFTFFRDPFSVSLVKNMFEFSILIPVALAGVNKCIAYACRDAALRTPLLHERIANDQ